MNRPLSLALGLTATLALSGCVSLFPKTSPATTYKLVATLPAQSAATGGKPQALVLLGPIAFTRPAAQDRILTTNGLEAAYIADARWVAPAPVMFQEALASAFDSQSVVNLATRGEAVGSDYTLRVEIRTFEAQYAADQAITAKSKKPLKLKAPTVAVEAHVTLVNLKQKAEASEITFRETEPAADNRVSAIVGAYGVVTTKLIGDIVGWTGKTAIPPTATATKR
jgi:cholesterol transport system auxiliary component